MRFLVVGDVMTDHYYRGNIRRLNPEKHSAPLLEVSSHTSCPGGAANVAANISAMGAQATLVSQSSGTITKCRLVDEDDGIIARFDEDGKCEPASIAAIERAAYGNYCAVIVSDYGKGAIDDDIVGAIKLLQLPTFVDTKVRPGRWNSWCTAMFPNLAEFNAHVDEYRLCRLCILKKGRNGAAVLERGTIASVVEAKPKVVKNVTGAGDTVVAAYAVAYMAQGSNYTGDRTVSPLRMAMCFAAAAVANPLTAAPTFFDAYGICLTDYAKFIEKRLSE